MRTLLWLISLIIFVLLLVGIIGYFNGAFFLSRILSSSLDTKVKVDKVIFAQEEIIIENIAIKNPRNLSGDDLIFIKKTSIKAPYKNYFHKEVEISQLLVEGVNVHIDFLGKDQKESNWTEWSEQMQQDTLAADKAPVTRWALIRELLIQDINVQVSLGGLLDKEKHISRIKMNDVRTKDGELTKQLIRTIISSLMYNLKDILNLPLNMGQDAAQDFFKPFKKFFNSGT